MVDTSSWADRWVADYRRNAAHLAAHGLYDPSLEHDACGVGFVAAIDGKPRREVVQAGIDALRAVWHRGAVDADGKTGDGAGIHLEIAQDFFKQQIRGAKDAEGRIAVGMVFLPRTDFNGQERCRTIVETEVLGFGYSILGWRQVPVDTSVIGEKAIATRPEIEQIVIGNPKGAERRRVRARAVPDPPPDRAPRARRAHPRLLHLLDLVPLGDLQGPVPGRAAVRVLSGPERRALRLRASRSSTSATRPTPGRPGGSPSRSGCSPTTARSTRCAATSTG